MRIIETDTKTSKTTTRTDHRPPPAPPLPPFTDPDSAKVYYLLSAQRGNVESRVKVGDWWYYGGMGERGGEGWRGGLWKMAREMRETGIMEWMGIRDR